MKNPLSYCTFTIVDTLNLPKVDLKIRRLSGKPEVFDEFRRRWVILSPEEWVRQHLLHYFKNELEYPSGRIAIEKSLPGMGPIFRTDIVVYNSQGKASLIVEVKAATVKVDTSVFSQAAKYNLRLGVPFLAVSNGLLHYCAKIDLESGSYSWMEKFPDAEEIES